MDRDALGDKSGIQIGSNSTIDWLLMSGRLLKEKRLVGGFEKANCDVDSL